MNRAVSELILCASMSRRANGRATADVFARIRRLGMTLPEVESATRYDGSPVLKAGGCFMAAVASHPSAEPASVVVRMDVDQRHWLLEDAPETYYVTDYYEKYPLVLVRAARVGDDALRDLLAVSRTLTLAKARPGRRARRRSHG